MTPLTAATRQGDLFALGVVSAARAIRCGEVSAETYANALLEAARDHDDLRAFITIDEEAVLEAARQADRSIRTGRIAPLIGVPLGIKDSYLTRGLATTLGTSVLAGFTPAYHAAAVARVTDAGAVVLGKNNLVEMSYGLTGLNEHYGQVENPHDRRCITGGSSSGGAAAVAAGLVPAALGGDTVGSIRVPAALCGVVGFKPTPGRWPSHGVAPISPTLDTAGVLARTVEDCTMLDTVITVPPAGRNRGRADLRHTTLAYAPRQHLADIDGETEGVFRRALRRLTQAGATLVEVDLGHDFFALSAAVTWPVFFHETRSAVRAFLAAHDVPVSFEQIHARLGPRVQQSWARSVIPSGTHYVSGDAYRIAVGLRRPELRHRLAALVFARADALLFPTTACAAPRIDSQWLFQVADTSVTDVDLARHTHPSSAAGVPAISLPMGLTSAGLPLGLEIDASPGRDRELLALAGAVERAIGPLSRKVSWSWRRPIPRYGVQDWGDPAIALKPTADSARE